MCKTRLTRKLSHKMPQVIQDCHCRNSRGKGRRTAGQSWLPGWPNYKLKKKKRKLSSVVEYLSNM